MKDVLPKVRRVSAGLNEPERSGELTADELWMAEALKEAGKAESSGEVPVGAVVVYENQVVGRGFNRNLLDCDPSAHAEIVAMRQAGRSLKNHRLKGCTMFVTIEPCAMCAGALVHARFARLVYGTDDAKAGAVHSVMRVVNHPNLNHKMEVTPGVLAERCAQTIKDFFRSKRKTAVEPEELDTF